MRPQAAHAREVVLELRELDLELALGGVRVRGEDVEDDRGAVDHRHAERLLEVALLARRELVVAGDQVGVGPRELGLQLLELAGSQVRVGMRVLAALDELADAGDAGGSQQLPELGQLVLVAVRERRDQERALARAALRSLPVGRRLRASVAGSLHTLMVAAGLPASHCAGRPRAPEAVLLLEMEVLAAGDLDLVAAGHVDRDRAGCGRRVVVLSCSTTLQL